MEDNDKKISTTHDKDLVVLSNIFLFFVVIPMKEIFENILFWGRKAYLERQRQKDLNDAR